jgi:hypothetical protein
MPRIAQERMNSPFIPCSARKAQRKLNDSFKRLWNAKIDWFVCKPAAWRRTRGSGGSLGGSCGRARARPCRSRWTSACSGSGRPFPSRPTGDAWTWLPRPGHRAGQSIPRSSGLAGFTLHAPRAGDVDSRTLVARPARWPLRLVVVDRRWLVFLRCPCLSVSGLCFGDGVR